MIDISVEMASNKSDIRQARVNKMYIEKILQITRIYLLKVA